MNEGNLNRYLIYGIGEIVLVVIGILIALQFNTLKNEQNDRRVEKMVLHNLRVDLQKDTINLNEVIKSKSNQIESSQYMIS
ncbi:DUF6090 family protein, partial [Candidatus Bathyarchaeota archaeon]|nr:DUF6090 family protein [Candidatus Bathyarchaeota archaeon]